MASAAEQLAANLNFGAIRQGGRAQEANLVHARRARSSTESAPTSRCRASNPDAIRADLFKQQASRACSALFNMFSGGAVEPPRDLRAQRSCPTSRPRSSCSCCRASVIPTPGGAEEGGRVRAARFMNQYTRYLTLVLALVFQSLRASASACRDRAISCWSRGRSSSSRPRSRSRWRDDVPAVARRADHQHAVSATASSMIIFSGIIAESARRQRGADARARAGPGGDLDRGCHAGHPG